MGIKQGNGLSEIKYAHQSTYTLGEVAYSAGHGGGVVLPYQWPHVALHTHLLAYGIDSESTVRVSSW